MRRATRKPDFFIVGGPKCGTTSMGRFLSAHPEIFMAPGEPHFFADDIRYHRRPLSERDYLRLFAGAGESRRVGERSTWQLFSKTAAERIRSYCPDAQVIIQVRNPVDLLRSLHRHLLWRGEREDIPDLGEALAAENERRQGRRIPRHARFVEHLYYSEIPRFSEQIERYMQQFSREQIKVIVFDDLGHDPSGTYREVLRFLQVEESFIPPFTIHNPSGAVRYPALHRLSKRIRIKYFLRPLLPEPFYERLRARRQLRRQQRIPRQQAPAMPEPLAARLRSEFQEEVERLSDLLERDLTHWITPPPQR